MNTLFKVFVTVVVVIIGLVTVIKIIQKCSWKDAVGIVEEFFNEMRENCRSRCCPIVDEDEVPEKV